MNCKLPLVIDAKLIPTLDRSIFVELRAAGVTAANIICSIWEGPEQSRQQLARVKGFVRDNSDLLTLVGTIADIDAAYESARVGVIPSWQNASGFDYSEHLVEEFAAAGVRAAQPTFVARSPLGSSCLDETDAGLSDRGRRWVAAMNQFGISIDLSHVGDRTAADIVRASARPVFFSQCSPSALNDAGRNKSDALLQAVADRGGVVCLTTIRQYLPRGLDSTVDDLADTIRYVVDLVGSESVGVGTDLTPGQGDEFFDYISHVDGDGTRLMHYTTSPIIPGFETFAGYENLRGRLRGRGLTEMTIDRIMGTNLRRFYTDTWTQTSTLTPSGLGVMKEKLYD